MAVVARAVPATLMLLPPLALRSLPLPLTPRSLVLLLALPLVLRPLLPLLLHLQPVLGASQLVLPLVLLVLLLALLLLLVLLLPHLGMAQLLWQVTTLSTAWTMTCWSLTRLRWLLLRLLQPTSDGPLHPGGGTAHC